MDTTPDHSDEPADRLPPAIDAALLPPSDPLWAQLRRQLGRANRRTRLTNALVSIAVGAVTWAIALAVTRALDAAPLVSASAALFSFLVPYLLTHTALTSRTNGDNRHRHAEVDARHLELGAWWRANPATVGGSLPPADGDCGALLATPRGFVFLPGRPDHDELTVPWSEVRSVRVLGPRWSWGWSPGIVIDTNRGTLSVACSKGPKLLGDDAV
ncbi:MAG: hypothetical protein JJU45_09945 [Acidimicrobiia bacterium]|nr:hypothetical protein [Acidimicrobiia bacterium]